MTRKTALVVFLFSAWVFFSAQSPSERPGLPASGIVYHLKIGTEVDKVLATYVARTLSVAEKDGAKLIIVELNTPGGEMHGMWDIKDSLVSTRIPTVAWVNKNAASAGAMITYACRYIVMAPGATFGACVPVMLSPIEGPKVLPEKFISYTRGQIGSVAAANGHQSDIAEAMVDEAIELKFSDIIPTPRRQKLLKTLDQWETASPKEKKEFKWFLDSSGELSESRRDSLKKSLQNDAKIVEKGKILTLDTDKAFLLNVAIGKASSLSDVFELDEIRALNLGHPIIRSVKWSWSELAAKFLSTPLVSSLLLIGGIIGIATELKLPGFGFPGILGIGCILLLFFGNFAAGAAQWTYLILFGLGVALLLVELFIIPGFGVVGILGILLIMASIFLMLLRTPGPHLPPGRDEILRVVMWMSASLIVAGLGIYILSKLISPRTPLFGRLVLAQAEIAREGYSAGAELATRADLLVGQVGDAKSFLRPAGKAVFAGRLFDVVTQGDMIEKGSKVEIIEVKGNRVVVQKAKEG